MKQINLIIILFLVFSCSNEKELSKFEKTLGLENSNTLDFLVREFENNFLKKQYSKSNLNESYKQFLIDFKNENSKNWKPIPKKIFEVFSTSNLKKEMYYHPDSVWILPNSSYDKIEEDSIVFIDVNYPYIKLKKKDLMFSKPDKIVYQYDRHYINIDSTINKDSLINRIMNLRYTNFYNGKYIQAIHNLHQFGGFFERFSDLKSTTNNKKILCDLILEKGDLSNKLVRKLIVLEFVL